MLSFAYLLTSFSIPVWADSWTATESGGTWHDDYAGLRFSLVAPDNPNTDAFDSSVLCTVDIFDYEKRGWGYTGSIGDTFSGGYLYRVFHQCKVDVAKDPDYLYNIDSKCIDVAPATDTDFYNRIDNWYCADIDEVFTHSENAKSKFYPSIVRIDDKLVYFEYQGFNEMVTQFNQSKEYFKNMLISDGDENTYNDFLGICDILAALGLDVYENAFNADGSYNKRMLYTNIVEKFLIPNYAIVIEPVFWVPLYCYAKNAEGKYVQEAIMIYYGSTTELGMLEARDGYSPSTGFTGIAWGDDSIGYTRQSGAPLRLRMSVVTMAMGQKAMFLTDEYKEEIALYCGTDNLVPANYADFDYCSYSSFDNIPQEAKDRRPNMNSDNYNEAHFLNTNYPGWFIASTSSVAYNTEFMHNYACGMTMITSSDIVKPIIEAFDYEFPVDTEVVTSVEVSNKSLDESYLPSVDEVSAETVTNANGVPVSLVCEFVMSEIEMTDENGITNSFVASVFDEATGQWKMTDEVKSRFYTEEGYDDSNPPDEDDAEPLPDIPAAYYATIDGLVSKGVSMENGYADAFASVNWTTPKQPCKVKFRVNFYNADYDIEPVLGTAGENSRNGQRETKISSYEGTGICYTDFECVINEKFRTTVSEIELPNPVSITSVETASVISDPDERERYEQSVQTRDDYFDESETSAVLFNNYTTDITGGAQPSTVHKWTEFVSYNNGTDIGLNVYQHKAEAVIENDKNSLYDDGTSRVVRTDINGLYEPYSDKLASGYGFGIDFTTHFNQDPLGLSYNRSFTMRTVNGSGQINEIACSNNIVTNYQRGAALLPEYLYKDYYAEIEPVETAPVIGKELLSRYCLIKNKNSINYENEEESEKSRIHFTPVWYPDGKYQIAVFMTDAYTPVGQLWYYRLYDIEIDGSIYDTWYVTRTNNY